MSTDPHNLFNDIRVVGFDLDQTLYPKSSFVDEAIQSYLYQKIAEHRDVSVAEGEQLFKERYRSGAGMSGSETLKDLGIPNGSDLVQEALEHADLTSVLIPDPETKEFLASLRKSYAGVDILTGSNLEQTHKKLAALDLELDLFTHVITADEYQKSTGESYTYWMSLYPALRPEEFLYIGDRVRTDHDVPSALGIRTCLVYAKTPDASLSTVQLANFKDLIRLVP